MMLSAVYVSRSKAALEIVASSFHVYYTETDIKVQEDFIK